MVDCGLYAIEHAIDNYCTALYVNINRTGIKFHKEVDIYSDMRKLK